MLVYLLLTVACSVLLGFIFKLFGRYGIDGFQAIVVNYFTCFVCGWLHLGRFPVQADTLQAPWLPYALVLGLVFVSGFNMAMLTVRYFGVTVGQIMQKMSILMTVPFAILAYGESAGGAKILGFLCALASIVLVNWPSGERANHDTAGHRRWIPVATWLLAGLLEVLLVRVQHENLTRAGDPTFIITIFGTAGTIGFLLAIAGWIGGRMRFSWKNVAAGIVLGIPNYGSMLFLLLALESGLEASFVFPAANVGIIVVTTIGAVTLFGERLSRLNWIGILLAVAAIGLLAGIG
jgi:drug/metabolite transporter (DMT)-like permease